MMTIYSGWNPRLAALLAATTLCVFSMTAPRAWSQPRTPREYEVKAAFLYNFAKFTELPAVAFTSPDAPFVFCILGQDPFGKDVEMIQTKTINGRAAELRRLHSIPDPGSCHLIFISSSESERLTPILTALGASGALLVSDMPSFAERGGMISFVMQEDSVGFKINVDAVVRAGLSLHSRLLKMATIVNESRRSRK